MKPRTASVETGVPSLPPPDFPKVASFALTAEEGLFLRERVVLTHPHTYLVHSSAIYEPH